MNISDTPVMSVLNLSADLGLAAVLLITCNICIGLLIAMRYSPRRRWPRKRVDIFLLHRWTAYAAVAVLLIHPAVLLLLQSPKFRVIDLLLPVNSPSQPVQNTIGAGELYLLMIVLLTSMARLSIGRPLWKRLHYLNYPAAAAWFIHSLLTDAELKNRPTDWLDAEKMFIEICFVLILATAWFSIMARRRSLGCRLWHLLGIGNHRTNGRQTLGIAIAGLILTAVALLVSLGFNYLQYTWRNEERAQHARDKAEAKVEQERKERTPPEFFNMDGISGSSQFKQSS
jgi:predicted ferric reductase